MKKNIVFDTAIENSKIMVEYAPYGFNTSVVTPDSKKCICCLGDSDIGCIVARIKGKETADVTYCHPFKIPSELTYPSLKWSNVAREFKMTKKTPNGRILIAKPIVEKDRINGVRFLCAEDDTQEAMSFMDLKNSERYTDRVSLSTILKACIINPD